MSDNYFYKTLDDEIIFFQYEKLSEDFDEIILKKNKFKLKFLKKVKIGNIINFKNYKSSKPEKNMDYLLEENERLNNVEQFYREGQEFMIHDNDDDFEEERTNDSEGFEQFDNMEDSIKFLVDEIEVYYDLYKIPEIKISDYEWDIFFNTLYIELEKRELLEKYYETLYKIIRFTLAKALVYEYKKLKITNFIEVLSYLENKQKNFPFSLSKKEILLIQQNILSQVHKTISFEEAVRKRH